MGRLVFKSNTMRLGTFSVILSLINIHTDHHRTVALPSLGTFTLWFQTKQSLPLFLKKKCLPYTALSFNSKTKEINLWKNFHNNWNIR